MLKLCGLWVVLGGWDLSVLCMYTCEWGSAPVMGVLCFDHLIAVLYIDIKAVNLHRLHTGVLWLFHSCE